MSLEPRLEWVAIAIFVLSVAIGAAAAVYQMHTPEDLGGATP